MKKRTQPSSKGVSYVSRKFVKFCLLWIFSLSSLMIQAQDNQRISVDLRGESQLRFVIPVFRCSCRRITAAFRHPCRTEKTVDTCYGCYCLVHAQFRFTEQLASYVGLRDGVWIEQGDVQPRMS